MKPTPKPKIAPAVRKPKPEAKAEPGVVARPRDVVRLGLPVGALASRESPEGGMSGGLLVAAALLFVAAAGGSLLLGLAARGALRHA